MVENRPVDVAAAGHICLDIIPKFPEGVGKTIEEIMRPGKLVNIWLIAVIDTSQQFVVLRAQPRRVIA